ADGVVGPDTAAALGLTDWGVIELRRGSTGSPVAHVQGVLMAAGIDLVGGADGVFGRYTEAAVRRFQTDHGLAADGVVGPDTAAALGLTDWASWSTGNSAGQAPSGGDGPVFPTRPTCTFSDTFGAPRPNGRTHEGVDIMAPQGAPVYAMYPGTITKITRAEGGSIAGNAVRVSRADGSYVFYAHLDTFSTAAVVGTTVTAGEVLGTVGRTGNASTPHLHLELHPGGGAAINPYPVVRTLVTCT
ncbi:MAG: M23 family metallopeptidase, partial [Ilumatobacteraceae bacterium]